MKAIEVYNNYIDNAYTCDRCGMPFIPADDVDAGFEEGHAYAIHHSAKCPCCDRKFNTDLMEPFATDEPLEEIKEFAKVEGIDLIFSANADDGEKITADTIEELTAKMNALGYNEEYICVEEVTQDTEDDNTLIVAVY